MGRLFLKNKRLDRRSLFALSRSWITKVVQKMCVACEVLCGGCDDSYDWREALIEEQPDLGHEDVKIAANAWLRYFQEHFGGTYEDWEPIEESEDLYMIDVVLDLLDRAKHPLFSPIPDWVPKELLTAAKNMARAEALVSTGTEKFLRSVVHDRLAPPSERLLKPPSFASALKKLSMTSKQMQNFTLLLFGPVPSEPDTMELLKSLHTCDRSASPTRP